MQKIKFRVWNSLTSKMIYDTYPTFEKLKLDYLHYMQYTGLKDKNGVEIYEGDVVRSYIKPLEDWELSGYITEKMFVKWSKQNKDLDKVFDYSWKVFVRIQKYKNNKPLITDIVTMDRLPMFWLKNECFGYEGEELQNPKHFEVIGNIYENAELLPNINH